MYDPARDAFTGSDDTPADYSHSSEMEAAEHSSTKAPPVQQLARTNGIQMHSGKELLSSEVC